MMSEATKWHATPVTAWRVWRVMKRLNWLQLFSMRQWRSEVSISRMFSFQNFLSPSPSPALCHIRKTLSFLPVPSYAIYTSMATCRKCSWATLGRYIAFVTASWTQLDRQTALCMLTITEHFARLLNKYSSVGWIIVNIYCKIFWH